MRLQGKTLDDLFDLELELKDRDEASDGYYSDLINVYKAMYRMLNRRQSEDFDEGTLQFVKNKIIEYQIKYGTYMKTSLQKDPYAAKQALGDALKYDQHNPIANYRLGFLAYQEKSFLEALNAFQHAIKSQHRYSNTPYLLNETQLYFAQLYTANSALYIADQTQKEINRLDSPVKNLPYEISPLLNLIKNNEEELQKNAFICITREGTISCSKKQCDLYLDNEYSKLILYYGERQIVCKYKEEERTLSLDKSGILRKLLVESSLEKPRNRHMFTGYFDVPPGGEVIRNTFRQKIARLKNDLQRLRLENIIQQTMVNNEMSYYIDESIPFIIMYRVDDVI